MAYKVRRVCDTCGGDGLAQLSGQPYNTITCWECGGTGEVDHYQIPGLQDKLDNIEAKATALEARTTVLEGNQTATMELLNDIMDRCNDILDKCNDILEQVTP